MGRTQRSKGTKDIANPSSGNLDGRVPSTVGAGKYPSYPAYKDSGVEWLGEIPAHWDVERTNSILDRNDSGVWGEDSDDDGIIVIRSTEQAIDGKWKITEPARRRLTTVEYATSRLQEGDLVVTKSSGSSLHIGKTSMVTEDVEALNCCFSNFMQRLRVNESSIPGFVLYVLNGETGRKQFEYLSATTTGLANLNGDLIGRVRFARPPRREQRTIAAFLDRETAKIDALVAKKERLIELLQEKRTALITRAVTNGLDPNIPMKNSGVEWLGQIPEHWNVKRLKYLVAEPLQYGANEPAESIDRSLPRYIRITDICDDGTLRDDSFRSLPEEIAKPYLLSDGDILFARSGATVGKSFRYNSSWGRAAYAGYLIRARTDQGAVQSEFVSYYSQSRVYRDWLLNNFIQATIQNVSAERYSNLWVSVPSIHEQRAIAAHLDREKRKIDALAAKVREAINRLKELRTALISAAVTGKIDVRETAA